MTISQQIIYCLNDVELCKLLETSVSTNRIQNELIKMFKYNTIESINILSNFPKISNIAFKNIWLKPTNEKIRNH